MWGRRSGGPERAAGLQLGMVFVEESGHGIWAIRGRPLSPSKAASHVEMRKFSAAELWPSAEGHPTTHDLFLPSSLQHPVVPAHLTSPWMCKIS